MPLNLMRLPVVKVSVAMANFLDLVVQLFEGFREYVVAEFARMWAPPPTSKVWRLRLQLNAQCIASPPLTSTVAPVM
jgi:hypothetical protein